MIEALEEIEVITLFVDDLASTKSFYDKVFNAVEVHGDANCSVLKFRNIAVNLLKSENASALIVPLEVGEATTPPRMLFTIQVKDVDAVCARLESVGVSLLNGPVDRPWGRRTAAFADPSGHSWEVAQLI